MTPCVCGCPMHGGSCPHCGCSTYQPDDGTDGPKDPNWAWHSHGYFYEASKAAGGISL